MAYARDKIAAGEGTDVASLVYQDKLFYDSRIEPIDAKSIMKDFGMEMSDAEIDRLLISMNKYGIITKENIALMIATMGHESGMGKYMLELGTPKDFEGRGYSYETRGAGYIQITHDYNHNAFLEDMGDGDMNKYKTKDGKSYDKNNTAQYIADNYSIEAAAWVWSGGNGKFRNINAYVNRYGSSKTIFLMTQYMINGFPEGSGKDMVYARETGNYTIKDDRIYIRENSYPLPQGWQDRSDKYDKIMEWINN